MKWGSLMNQRILVTGGAGFLGFHLCEKLLKQGNEVICMDNFCTGSKANIEQLYKYEGFSLVEHDVTLPYYTEVSQIYNLASPASPVHYQKNPVQTIKTNVLGAINMLELAKETGARILQTSTSEIYGDPHIHPQKEDYWGNVNTIGPRACYDEGKRVVETLFFDYKRQFGIDIKVMRIFNTYGPNMQINDGRVMSNFIVQALKNEDITIYGDGSQTRSFCYVSDLIDGMYRLMNSAAEFTSPVNIGNPEELTVLELAERIIDITGSKSKIVYRPLPIDDPTKRKPDITLAKKMLNWEPKVSVKEGIEQTVQYFKLHCKTENSLTS